MMRLGSQRRAAALALAIAAIFLASSPPRIALADGALDKASAESLFEDAMKLMADKHYPEACPKLEESQRLDPAIGTQFRLAECYEATGRIASAWANFLEVADTAKNGGQADRERVARQRAAVVEARLSRLTVTVTTPDLGGLEIRRGGVALGKAQWGTAVPVDPSTYEIRASAPGKQDWVGSAVVSGEGTTATVTVPELQEAPVASPQPAVPVAPPPPPPAPSVLATEPRASDQGPGALRVTGLITAGVGVVGLGVGTYFGIQATSKKNEAQSAGCSDNQCTPSAGATRDDARSAANVSTIFFVAGGVLTAGGLAVWLFAPGEGREGPSASARLVPGGVALEGAW